MKDSPYPHSRAQRTAPFIFTCMRSPIVSLIVQAVKYHSAKSACTCTDSNACNRGRCPEPGCGCLLLARDLLAVPLHEAGAGGNELAYNHIFLQTYQVVGLRLNRRLC